MEKVNLTRSGTGITDVLMWIVFEAGKQMIQNPSVAETLKSDTETKIIDIVSSYLSVTNNKEAVSAAQELGVATLNILPQFIGENGASHYKDFCEMLTALSVNQGGDTDGHCI